MIYILHGEDTTSLRTFLLALKKQDDSRLIEVQLNDGGEQEALGSYLTQDLFNQKSLVVLDITKHRTFDFEDYSQKLEVGTTLNDFVFYCAEPLRKTHQLFKIKFKTSTTLKEFNHEIKPSVFAFLDALFEKRKKEAYSKYFEQVSSGSDFELFSMIVYGVRNLAMAQENSRSLTSMHPFAKSKALNQAKNFTKEEISEIYGDLYSHDLNIKTGKSSIDIVMPLLIEKITKR